MENSSSGTVLITGYSGQIASHISSYLKTKGFAIKGLTQNKKHLSSSVFHWHIEQQTIDTAAFENVDYVIHLAGAGVTDKRWTQERKKEIIESRVKSALFLADSLKQNKVKLKALIGTSAAGFYGTTTSPRIFSETDPASTDFLGECCRVWENSYQSFSDVTDRQVILRLPVVLCKNGTVLKKIMPLVNLGIASPIGSGQQYMPLACMDDLARLYEFALTNHLLKGTFNANAPAEVTNKQFMKALADAANKPFFMPKVPAFVLKMIYGEMASVLLEGSRLNSQKIREAGFTFNYPTLESMVKNVL